MEAKDIATKLKVRPNTVGDWIKKGNWKKIRDANINQVGERLDRIQQVIDELSNERLEIIKRQKELPALIRALEIEIKEIPNKNITTPMLEEVANLRAELKNLKRDAVYITAKPKTASKTAKNSDSGVSKQKTVEIPTNIVKQPENANMGDLQHRASKITGLIMSNRLSDRFKQGDESIMQMMARIQNEITTDAIADQWENKLEEFGVVF
jgi:uncharacterized protein YjcR